MGEQKAGEQAGGGEGKAPAVPAAVAMARQLDAAALAAGRKLAFEAEPADFLATLERLGAAEDRA